VSPQLKLIHKVLLHAGIPLTVFEILGHAKSMGVWITDAKQPWTVIHSRISVDIAKKGGTSRFIRVTENPTTFMVRPPKKKAKKKSKLPKPGSQNLPRWVTARTARYIT